MAKLDLGLVVGPKGEQGDSVTGVRLKSGTHAAGTTDTYEVTLSNGKTATGTIDVYNGRDGIDGKNGTNGIDGKDGADGKNGAPGAKGDQGPRGLQGEKGADATINGVNAVTIEAGSNVKVTTGTAKVTISATVSTAWTCTLTAAGWTAATDNFGGIYAQYKQEITCTGMTADTDITAIQFAGGDFASCAAYQWYVRPGAGSAVFWSPGKPAANFSVKLVEVKK